MNGLRCTRRQAADEYRFAIRDLRFAPASCCTWAAASNTLTVQHTGCTERLTLTQTLTLWVAVGSLQAVCRKQSGSTARGAQSAAVCTSLQQCAVRAEQSAANSLRPIVCSVHRAAQNARLFLRRHTNEPQ